MKYRKIGRMGTKGEQNSSNIAENMEFYLSFD